MLRPKGHRRPPRTRRVHAWTLGLKEKLLVGGSLAAVVLVLGLGLAFWTPTSSSRCNRERLEVQAALDESRRQIEAARERSIAVDCPTYRRRIAVLERACEVIARCDGSRVGPAGLSWAQAEITQYRGLVAEHCG